MRLVSALIIGALFISSTTWSDEGKDSLLICAKFAAKYREHVGGKAYGAALKRLLAISKNCLVNAVKDACITAKKSASIRDSICNNSNSTIRCPGIALLAIAGVAGKRMVDRCAIPDDKKEVIIEREHWERNTE